MDLGVVAVMEDDWNTFATFRCFSRAGRRLISTWAGLSVAFFADLSVARLVLTNANDTHGHKKVGSGPGLLHHNRLGFSVKVTSTLHSPIDGLTPRQILQIKTLLFGLTSR